MTDVQEGLVAPDGQDPARPQSDSAAASEQVRHTEDVSVRHKDACSEWKSHFYCDSNSMFFLKLNILIAASL